MYVFMNRTPSFIVVHEAERLTDTLYVCYPFPLLFLVWNRKRRKEVERRRMKVYSCVVILISSHSFCVLPLFSSSLPLLYPGAHLRHYHSLCPFSSLCFLCLEPAFDCSASFFFFHMYLFSYSLSPLFLSFRSQVNVS